MAVDRGPQSYAVNMITTTRSEQTDMDKFRTDYIDLAEVITVEPDIVIEPLNRNIQYEESDLLFAIDSSTLSVGDTVVMGRDPSEQPIVIAVADDASDDFTNDPAYIELQDSIAALSAQISALEDELANFEPAAPADGDVEPPVLPVLIPTIHVNSDYTVLLGDDTILVDSTNGPVTITLPATALLGQCFFVKDEKGTTVINPITVVSADGDLIDGGASYTLTANLQANHFCFDGTEWNII